MALDFADRLISCLDKGLRVAFSTPMGSRASPAQQVPEAELSTDDKQLAGALMRVNHVGEVCAQALYDAQGLLAADEASRAHFEQAAQEEWDHLAWTDQRVRQLGTHTSRLVPLWYAGAFGIGLLAGLGGRQRSYGFMVETERQVEAHLASHLDRLPAADRKSRAIVDRMREEEAQHAGAALQAGGAIPPRPVQGLMRMSARVMTTVAHRI
ncbi:MAG: 2-polyprenyl-3-methyl-6-methoxy-1,4-benzoquinone monooxygenase [Burkholderiaceae bacterium]|nr:2-polyprenyl-3-methyl-6-methoxy-1,4-benzoquinone monooxygenase [Roseateles sp.]MBV8471115.1 2-polyprenyl-3-methyl-6-methoxy-1,4-benzoquinone monooxygenase [Burkholderiaceae bacterium]